LMSRSSISGVDVTLPPPRYNRDMTVGELIEKLQKADLDMRVVVSPCVPFPIGATIGDHELTEHADPEFERLPDLDVAFEVEAVFQTKNYENDSNCVTLGIIPGKTVQESSSVS
jgi:hypothetical protein